MPPNTPHPDQSQSSSGTQLDDAVADIACAQLDSNVPQETGETTQPAKQANSSPIDLSEINDLCSRTSLRANERLPWKRPIEMLPMSLDGMVYAEHRVFGESIEISNQGVSVRTSAGNIHVSQAFLLGVQMPQGGVRHAGVIVQRIENLENGTQKCACEFGGPAEDILRLGAMTPEFSQQLMAFVLPHGPTIYDNWTQAGVMQKSLIDRVLVCPRCTVLPTFRNACRKCKSGRVTNDKLVHHFTCAYVGLLSEFESNNTGGLICPKCRVRNLVVGSDYEYLTGQYRCQSCGWRDSDAEVVGHCLKCSNRFDLQQARELELYLYDVHRLDALAITAQLA
jgi:hypothetical protein